MEHGQRNNDMRKIILCATVLFMLAGISYAETYCMWDGSQGQYCQSDSKGYIQYPRDYSDKTLANNKIFGTEADYNTHGFYRLIVTDPVLGADQVRDQEVWGIDTHPVNPDTITKTWTVRDMTATELDIKEAGPMPLSEYYLWKALIVKGVITQQEAANALPQELIDAYLARDRIENP